MNARRVTIPAVICLVLLGILGINLRRSLRHEKQVLPGDTFWHLTYDVSFKAAKPGAQVHAAFPVDTDHGQVTGHRNLQVDAGLEDYRGKKPQTREMGLVARKAGPLAFKTQVDIHLSPRAAWRPNVPVGNLTPEARSKCLQSEKAIQVDDPIVTETLDRLRRDPASKLELLDRLFEHCQTEIGVGGKDAPSDAAGALKHGVATLWGRARALVALCRAAKMPARLVTGFNVNKPGADVLPHVWAEVLVGTHWEPYDPDNGYIRELPHYFLPVRRDASDIVRGSRTAAELQVTYSITRAAPPVDYRSETPTPADILDLTRLPLEMQRAFEIILLMPIGALVTSIFRTIVGLRTFGTFTPTLIALAFVFNDWRTGLVVFALVMVLGLASRTLLEQLKLLLVPRLSIILTLVALCIVFAVSVLDFYEVTPSAQAVLLPMVILTMTVERFYLTSEEDSPAFALQLLAGTAFVAVCCYLILRWENVGRLLLAYPEAHFLTIAVLVLLGRYAGYRLNELWRFRDLVDPRSP